VQTPRHGDPIKRTPRHDDPITALGWWSHAGLRQVQAELRRRHRARDGLHRSQVSSRLPPHPASQPAIAAAAASVRGRFIGSQWVQTPRHGNPMPTAMSRGGGGGRRAPTCLAVWHAVSRRPVPCARACVRVHPLDPPPPPRPRPPALPPSPLRYAKRSFTSEVRASAQLRSLSRWSTGAAA
jgi:hypothetical protein